MAARDDIDTQPNKRSGPIWLIAALVLALLPVGLPPAVAAGVSPDFDERGFPRWYQDDLDVRLQMCLDSPFCSGTSSGVALQGGRANWWAANASIVSGNVAVDLSLAARGGSNPEGVPISFGRIRVTSSSGLQPNSDYTITHPLGESTWTTNGQGGIGTLNAANVDTGCPQDGDTCDFQDALASPVFDGFLRWDTFGLTEAQGGPPVGFLGDLTTPHAVTGSPLGTNFFRIRGPGLPAGGLTTTLFTVEGRQAGPLAGGVASISAPLAGSANVTTTITNIGGEAMLLTNPATALAGTDASRFAVTGCAGAALAASTGSCDLGITFTPARRGLHTASLTVTAAPVQTPTAMTPLTIPLRGTGFASQATPTPTEIPFGNVTMGSSLDSDVGVNNTGNSPLDVSAPTITGPGAAMFGLTDGCTALVEPGGTCMINVVYSPTLAAPHSATLNIPSDDPEGTRTVALSGAGVDPGPAPPPPGGDTSHAGRTGGATTTRISPNGDGRLDGLGVDATFNEPTTWTFKVLDGTTLLHSAPGGGSRMSEVWNGSSAGATVADGTYSWLVEGQDAAGNPMEPLTGSVTVDTERARLGRFTLRPSPFRPEKHGVLRIRMKTTEDSSMDVLIKKRKRNLAALRGLNAPADELVRLVWNGTKNNGENAKRGIYKIVVKLSDRAENRSKQTKKIRLIR